MASGLLVSLGLHLTLAFPLRALVSDYFSSPGEPPAVRVVQFSEGLFQRNRGLKNPRALRAEKKTPEKRSAEKKKKESDRLRGQVVEVPATPNKRPRADAKFLAKHNSTVEKETTARPEKRDHSKDRLTNKLQSKERPVFKENTVKTLDLSIKGDGGTSEKSASKRKRHLRWSRSLMSVVVMG